MAAKTRRTATQAAYQPPAPTGCEAFERSDWLPDVPLEFVRDLRARHVELAHAWASAVDDVANVRDERAAGEREYRRQVRAAVAGGGSPAARPPTLDVALSDAKVAVAVEDADAAREDLSEHVLVVLAELRAHRIELAPYLAAFSPPLLTALSQGPGSQRAIVVERLRRAAEELAADGPAIEVFDDDSPVATPELEASTHA